MEESKTGVPPGAEQLTREQVMAQRAEKKKLKEARKNKNATGVTSGGGDGNEGKENTKVKKSQPQQPKVKPDQQPKSTAAQPPKVKPSSEPEQKPVAEKQNAPKGQQSKIKQQPAAHPQTFAPVQGSKTSTPLKAFLESVIPLTKNASVGEMSRTSDKSTHAGIKSTEFHSTIQSLFKNQRRESAKDKAFQPHVLFYNLSVKLKNNVIRGANQRCIKMLTTMKDFVKVYETPPGSTFKHGVTSELEDNLNALRKRCPFAIGMANAIEYFFSHMYKVDEDCKDVNKSKEDILTIIDQYIEEKIEKAVEAIVEHGKENIQAGDVIMVYSITEALLYLLETVAKRGTPFELIIIQTPDTMLDIPILLQKLRDSIEKRIVTVSSVNFSSAIYRMRHSTKLIIGGHGLFTTGGVMAQSGSGKLALLASTYNKPAIFLCETFKFCDRSPLDFFTLDEYMPVHASIEDDVFEPKIRYDVTPANLVTVVITDIDMLPSTSVPVVLRVQEGRSPRKDDSIVDAV